MTDFTFPQCLLISSSAIKWITVDKDMMFITFKNNVKYTYEIDKKFLSEVINSKSVGKTFNSFKHSLKLI